MTLGQNQEAFSRDLVALLVWCFEEGYEVRIGEVQRTPEQQEIYIKTGRSKTYNSMHIKKCAADLFVFKDGRMLASKEEMQPLGNRWESLDSLNSWGGNWNSFKDVPHFERRA